MTTPDQVPDIAAQRVQTRLNGELVQDQPISDMIWDIAFIIEYCSTFTKLEPGDVIATGTPGGVGDKRNPPLYMKAGDRVEVSIGTLGWLANPVIAEIRWGNVGRRSARRKGQCEGTTTQASPASLALAAAPSKADRGGAPTI